MDDEICDNCGEQIEGFTRVLPDDEGGVSVFCSVECVTESI